MAVSSGDDASSAGGGADRQELERVLREALLAPEGTGLLSRVEMDAVHDVAQRHRGRPFALEPVAVDLVQAILSTIFMARRCAGANWRTMSVAIATTLCDDPVAHERLESLWGRLSTDT